MRCPECGTENREGARFCDSCGAALEAPEPAAAPTAGEAVEGRPRDLPDALAAGRYRPERFLGRGGRKRVYLARGDDDRAVAVSVFETEGVGEAVLARARREAQAMGKLGAHPHIVGIVESGEDGAGPFIVSEHMPGGDVAGLLAGAERRRLDPEQAIAIAIDVTRALEHAHGCGIVHRDLKPANVWLGEDGRARLGDFGLALTSEGRSRAEPDGTLVGTVAYLPPEQALGRTSDARSDLYSLGALLYEMLTGQPPFPGDDAVAIMGQHLSATPVSPSKLRPGLPPDLDELVLALLAKRPEDRPANAAEARRALESIDLSRPTAPLVEAEENPLDRLAGGVFVGRERELGELRAAADEARGGAGGLVLLVGEPGIGKTRTAEEVATYARVQGARVHWGRCHEGEGVPAYWPWAEAIRSYVRDADPVGLAWELGAGAAEIARIVPELRERAGSAVEPGEADEHDEARFRLFDAVANFLAAAARSRPLMLVLDDLHWADEPSLLLLRFLARGFGDSPLLIAGTYRDVELGRHHPLARTLSELAGTERMTRVHLRGLDSAAVERYIEMSTGTAPAPGLADAVLEQTEGNPFFVSEVVRLLAAEGRLDAGAAGGAGSALPQIPQGVREVVGRRLDRLSGEANSVLAIAAAIGREFSLDVLARACESCAEERVMAALEEAAAARIVTEAGPRRYSFEHALVRETLYSEIPATRRAAVHGRIAAAIEELHGDDRALLSALAHQYLEAAPAGEPARAAEYARRAAGQATNRLAHEDAVALLARARDVLDFDRDSGPELRMEIELELGEAQTRASLYGDARETLEDAAAIAREVGDGEALARAACDVAALSEAGSFDRGIADLVEEALAGAGAEAGSLRSKLLSALAAEYYWEDPVGRAEPLSVEALELARRIGDDEAIASALVRRQFVAGNSAEGVRQRLAEADEIFEIGRRTGDLELEVRAYAYRVRAFLELGDIAGVDRELAAYESLADRLRQPQHLWHVPLLRGTRALIDGRFGEAERLGAEALAGGERAGEPLAQQFYAIQTALRMRLQGRETEIRDAVAGMAARYPAVPAWRCALASIEAQLGNLDSAREEFERIASRGFDSLPYDAQRVIALALVSDAAAVLGDAERAAELYELLCPYDGLNLVAGRAAANYGPVAGVLGRLARTMGRGDEAERRYETAIALCERMGERPFKAFYRYELAGLLLERGGEEDRARALDLLGRVIDTARDIGMPIVVERALGLRLEAQGLAGVDVTTSIDSMIEAVADERPDLSAHVADDGTVTILFSDIEDSTLMTERLGDERWLEVLRAHNALFRRRLREHRGFEVKSQGDGFMLVFREPGAALACASQIQRDLDASEVIEEERVRVRMGLHTGQAIREEGDLFGRSVILAARIAAQACGGEILVSESLREAAEAGAENGFAFDEGRELELKGLAGRHRVYRAEWEDAVAA
ncbi:MAG TPA: AAA family ATPase [Solirubrobacterales bacterium]